MIGSLARQLMQQAVAFAGDATRSLDFTILNSTDYDPETGTPVYTRTNIRVGRALLGRISEADAKKYALTTTTHKATVAMIDYEAAGSPVAEAEDEVLIGGKVFAIEKVVIGSMNQSVIFYVCEK